MDGIVVLNKPGGITSHQAVYSMRKLFPGVKAGHSGTLDPMATGVLPICLGRATRVVEYIIELPKVYRAEVVLGKTSDTEDATGNISIGSAAPRLTGKELEKVFSSFTGAIKQIPPLYSAVKYKGKPLYKWTREGEEVPRRIRTATVYSIELLESSYDREPNLIFDVHCSRGTYIRTLAADIGKAIGCGAYLASLVRISVGPYHLENSLTPEEVAEFVARGKADKVIKPVDSALVTLPALKLDNEKIKALKFGQVVILEKEDMIESFPVDQHIRIYNPDGNFKAIACLEDQEGDLALKTRKYLAETE